MDQSFKTNSILAHCLPADEIIKKLDSDSQNGLSKKEVEIRQQRDGKNELKAAKKTPAWYIFIKQFKSFIVYILIFALIVSLLAGETVEFLVILSILILNAVLGFLQEYRAEKAIDALKKISARQCVIIREGINKTINVEELVIGDIVILSEGNTVPADCRIIQASGMMISEASLTGESLPVSKKDTILKKDTPLADRVNCIFSGTSIVSGKAKAVVYAIGMQTELGKIAHLITSVEEEPTPLQKKLESFGTFIGISTLVICAIIFLIGTFKQGIWSMIGNGEYVQFILAAREWLLVSISLAVAAVPEGLPAIVTIALSIGVVRMAKRNALIRRLPSVETLGSTTVICTDKTGTLTKNELTVQSAWVSNQEYSLSGTGYDTSGEIKVINGKEAFSERNSILFTCGALCNNSSLYTENLKVHIVGDPTEAALLISSAKSGIEYETLRKKWARESEIPFTSERKMMSVLCVDPDKKENIIFCKGAPEKILEKCSHIFINGRTVPLNSRYSKEVIAKNEEFAKRALRVLGFAYKPIKNKKEISEKDEEKMIFIGLQGMIDPAHDEVKSSIEKCKLAGIRVVMITGDQMLTANAIAGEIGIEGKAMSGNDFSALTYDKQKIAVRELSIFTRVNPEHKLQIVRLLREQGEIVAMTGDGVNDAPAIKQADLGVAMGIAGTDVAKEASGLILLDDNFSTIVNAIEEGRGIYENIRKFTNYLLSCNLAEVLIIALALAFSLPLPMTAIMLLWLNLVTDGLPALALAVDPYPKNLMALPPRKTNEKLMNKDMLFTIVSISLVITFAVIGVFIWGLNQYSPNGEEAGLLHAQTLAFTCLILMELIRIYIIRKEIKISAFSNIWLILAVFSSIALHIIILYTSLGEFFEVAPLNNLDWIILIFSVGLVSIITFVLTIIKNKFLKN